MHVEGILLSPGQFCAGCGDALQGGRDTGGTGTWSVVRASAAPPGE